MATYLVDFENVHSEGLKGVDNLDENDRVYLFYSPNADSITFETHFKLMRSKAPIEMFEAKRTGKNAIDFHLSSFLGYLLAKDDDETYFVVSKDNGYQYSFDFWRAYFKETKIKLFYAYSIERGLNLQRKNDLSIEAQEEPSPEEPVAETKPNDAPVAEPSEEIAPIAEEHVQDDPEAVLTVDDILREQGHLPPKEEDVNAERREMLRKKLDEDLTDDELNKLISYLDNCETLQDLYRSIIRAFGQSRGLVVYRAVKKR